MRNISDGPSKCVAVGESLQFTGWGYQSCWGIGRLGAMGEVISPQMGLPVSTVRRTLINMTMNEAGETSGCIRQNACGNGNCDEYPYSHSVFSSRHPDGAQFLFGDGSVTFLEEAIDEVTWRHLNYIADGHVIDGDEY